MLKTAGCAAAVLFCTILSAGCTGNLGPDSGRGAGTGSAQGPSGPGGPNPEGNQQPGAPGGPLPATALRRLTRAEYNNTLRDLIGDETRPADTFLVDETKLGFDNIAEIQTTSPVRAEQYMLAAEKLAAGAGTALIANLSCAAIGDAGCAAQWIRDFGQQAYRRPLSETEVTRLTGVFEVGRQNSGFERGVELVLRTMLMSPSFLFRVELGEPAPEKLGSSRPTSWEMASRLSYTLLGSMPDPSLFQAAKDNALIAKEQIRAHAERLLGDARAKANIQHLHAQLFELHAVDPLKIKKDLERFPSFSEELVTLSRRETETFLDHIVWNASDGAKALFTGAYSFMNAKLAQFYGVTGPTGGAFEQVTLDPTRRAGLLTQASLLSRFAHADQTSPTLRGKFVRQRLLCTEIPPPPSDVDATPVEPVATNNGRERVTQHLVDPSCAGCHNLIDPIGLGFEHYDAMGAWQDQEGGKPIDASGVVSGATFAPPHDGHFNGVPDLAAQLAASPDVHACLTKHWFRFAYGREETAPDQAVLTELTSALQGSGGDFKQLLIALTQTDAFLYRGSEPVAP
jgi:hypothetical protein